eukprot:GHVR01036423.1.p2 GENE.GHVR01036423.1~~GHVR01036423.1.p2  ORF type:complete len:208 (+),score=11.99 GHVR01036423.1:852-1475(+)
MLQKVAQIVFGMKWQDAVSQCNLGGGSQSKCSQRITERIHRTQFAEHRDLLCVFDFANQGILPDASEAYPMIQITIGQRTYSPDNLEIPEHMTNTLGINMEQVIPYCGAKIPYVITHLRAGHGMTRKEGRNAPVPNHVWYTTDYTPVTDATLRRNELFEGTEKLTISYAGSKLQAQCIDFDMTDYVVHWTKAASFPFLLATGLVDNG